MVTTKPMAEVEINSLSAMMETFHDMAMSRDPFVAAQGRFAKRMFSELDKWIEDERARGTEPRDVLGSGTTICVSIMGSLFATLTAPGHRQDAMRSFTPHLERMWERMISKVSEEA